MADELNVDEIDTAEELSQVIQFELKPNFKTLGARLKDAVRDVQPALERVGRCGRGGRARGGPSPSR